MDQQLLDSSLQLYWKNGLQYFNDGDTATQAIQNLYADWMPPFNLNALAAIIGALYADNYWAAVPSEGQQMSVSTLANDISAAIGINLPDAQRAAQFAFSRWYGMFVRGNISNSGEIPKAGNLTASPDVLVNGQTSLSTRLIITNWNQATWGPQPGLKNYAYARAQSLNIGVDITKATTQMYYTDAGFAPPPSSWIQVFTFDGLNTASPLVDINQGTILSQNTRAASKDAFGVTFPGAGHYCMITAALTEFFTRAPDAGQGNWNSATWLQFNGAAGWHNIDVSSTGQATLKFYNQDAEPQRFQFEAHCHLLKAGTKVAMSSPGILKTTETTISGDYQLVTAEVEVPGNYTGDLQVDFGVLPANASITFNKYWILPKKHEHHRHAALMVRNLGALFNAEDVRVPMGDFTFVGAMT